MAKGSHRVLYNQIVARKSNFTMNTLLKWDKGYEEAMVVETTLNNPFIVFIRNLLQPFNDCTEDPGVRQISDTAGNLRKGGSFTGWMGVVSLT